MGWGERQRPGAGTTEQIERAHEALDRLDVPPGTLALRTLDLAARMSRFEAKLDTALVMLDLVDVPAPAGTRMVAAAETIGVQG